MGDCIFFFLLIMLPCLIPFLVHAYKLHQLQGTSKSSKSMIYCAILLLSLPMLTWLVMGISLSIASHQGGTIPTRELINGAYTLMTVLCMVSIGILIWDINKVSKSGRMIPWMIVWLIINVPVGWFTLGMLRQHTGHITTSLVSPDGKKKVNHVVEWYLFSGNGWLQVQQPRGSWLQYRIPSKAPNVEQVFEIKIYWTEDSEGIVIFLTRLIDDDFTFDPEDYPIEVWVYDFDDHKLRDYYHANLAYLASQLNDSADLSSPESIMNAWTEQSWPDLNPDMPGIANAYNEYFLLDFMQRHGKLSRESTTWHMDPELKVYPYSEVDLRKATSAYRDNWSNYTSTQPTTAPSSSQN